MSRSVPFVFNDPAYHTGLDGGHLCLCYKIVPCKGTQTRFRGRLFAEPLIDLKQYEFRAVFDWIEISVETARDHSALNLQRRLMGLNKSFNAFRTCFVSSPTRRPAHSGQGHVIKMQDPAPGGLSGLLRAFLSEECVPRCNLEEIHVTGMELSLDVYPAPKYCRDEADYATRRMLMTELLRKHIAVDEAYRTGLRRPRFVYKDGTWSKTQRLIAPSGTILRDLAKVSRATGAKLRDLASCEPAAHHQPVIDATFYFGKRQERLHYRLMDKITDNRQGDRADVLSFEKTRARVEFTFIDQVPGDGLGPASVGIKSICDLALGGLTSFNTLLFFELPTFERDQHDHDVPDQRAWEIFAKTGVAGLGQMDDAIDALTRDGKALRAKARQVVQSPGKRLRFSTMNARITKALRRLQERWRRDWA